MRNVIMPRPCGIRDKSTRKLFERSHLAGGRFVWLVPCFSICRTGFKVYSSLSQPRGDMKRASVVGVRAAIAAAASASVLVGVAVIWRGSEAIRTATEQVRAEHEFALTVQP